MGMKDVLKEAQNDVNDLGHIFKTKFQKNAKIIYLIVEGKDDITYYKHCFENFIPEDWEIIAIPASCDNSSSGCKKKLIKFYNKLDWRKFKKEQIVILTDRDLSDIINENIPKSKNIYVTDGYSIENSIVNDKTFYRTLTELCCFDEFDETSKIKLLHLFNMQLNKFCNDMINVMSWIIHWQKNNFNPKLQNIKVKNLFRITSNTVEFIPVNINEFVHKQCNLPYDNSISIEETKNLISQNPNKYTRGKYLFDFFKYYCETIIEDYNKISNIRFSRTGRAVKLDFLDIAHVSKCPKSLKEFINNTILKYIQKHS